MKVIPEGKPKEIAANETETQRRLNDQFLYWLETDLESQTMTIVLPKNQNSLTLSRTQARAFINQIMGQAQLWTDNQ